MTGHFKSELVSILDWNGWSGGCGFCTQSLDQFQSAEGQAAINQLISDTAADIGGFSSANLNTINTYRDNRGSELVDRAIADINLNNSQRDNTLKNEEVLVNNTASELHLLSKSLEGLPQGSEGYNQVVGQINKVSAEFGAKYPHLANKVQYAIEDIVQKNRGQDITGIKQDTDWYTAVTNKYFPLYMQYMDVDNEINSRYSNMGDLKGDELKKAQDNKAKDIAARDQQFGDLHKQLQDPFVRSALIQRATEALTAGQMDKAKYQEVISKIELNNARRDVLPIQAQASLNTSQAALQNADSRAYEVVSDAEIARDKLAAEQTSKAAEVTKAASLSKIENFGIKGNGAVFLNSDGTINPDKVKARYLAWGKDVATQYDQGFPKGLSIDTLSKGVYDKANKTLLEQSGSSAMSTLKGWMSSSKLSAGDQALIIQGIADGRLPITTGRWFTIRDHKDSKMTDHAKKTITSFLETEKRSYRDRMLMLAYSEGRKFTNLIMDAEGSSSIEEHMKKNNSFYASSVGNKQLRSFLDPELVKIHSGASSSTPPARTNNIPDQGTGGSTVGKSKAATGNQGTGSYQRDWKDKSKYQVGGSLIR